jgi:hypothetical protein
MIWSPQTIGDDHPRPGTSARHATFIVVDHVVGSVSIDETARPDGPRNCGHAVSPDDGAAGMNAVTNRTMSAASTGTPESYMTQPARARSHDDLTQREKRTLENSAIAEKAGGHLMHAHLLSRDRGTVELEKIITDVL